MLVCNSTKKNDVIEEVEEQSGWGSALPELILHKIFMIATKQKNSGEVLMKLGKVCSLWHRVSLNPSLWHTLNLRWWTDLKCHTDYRLGNFPDSLVAEEDLTKTEKCTLMMNLPIVFPKLEDLTLFGSFAYYDSEGMINDSIKSITELKLKKLSLRDVSTITSSLLSYIFEELKDSLLEIKIYNVDIVGSLSQMITAVATCPNLTVLDFEYTNQSTDQDDSDYPTLDIQKLQYGCPKLKILKFAESDFLLDMKEIDQQSTVSPGFPNLETLYLDQIEDQSMLNYFIRRVLNRSIKLKKLLLGGDFQITYELMQSIPAKDLRDLSLWSVSCSAVDIKQILSKWAHSLERVELKFFRHILIDAALEVLVAQKSASRLKHLNLESTKVSVTGVRNILRSCRLLEYLRITMPPHYLHKEYRTSEEIAELRLELNVPLLY